MKSRRFSIGHAVLAVALFAGAAAIACGEDKRDSFAPEPDGPSSLGSLDASDAVKGDDHGACVSQTNEAKPVALAMMLVMDRSGSMVGASKWEQARKAMIAFSDAPGVAGTKLGLTIFPADEGDECNPQFYTPIVPIGPVPANSVLIKSALESREPMSDTPMTNGLQGGIDAMREYLAANPNEVGVAILVTDGDPGGCNDDVTHVMDVATAAAQADPAVRTFVVGMDGATFKNLDMIAKAGGGAPSAFNAAAAGVDGGVSAQQQLFDALETIRAGAIGCEYVLPVPDATKGSLDLDSVVIDFNPGGNEPTVSLRRVLTEDDCGKTTGGFYYDDNDNPTRIVLCDASCGDVRTAGKAGTVDVVLGCIRPIH